MDPKAKPKQKAPEVPAAPETETTAPAPEAPAADTVRFITPSEACGIPESAQPKP